LPTGMVVATPNGLTDTCSNGVVTATAGTRAISLRQAILAADSSCTVSANVTGTAAGLLANTTGPVSATESGNGAASNTADLNVTGPPNISKNFGVPTILQNGTTTLSFTV